MPKSSPSQIDIKELKAALMDFNIKLENVVVGINNISNKSRDVMMHVKKMEDFRKELHKFYQKLPTSDIIDNADESSKLKKILESLKEFMIKYMKKAQEIIKELAEKVGSKLGQYEILRTAWEMIAAGCNLIKTVVTNAIDGTIKNAIATGNFAKSLVDFASAVKDVFKSTKTEISRETEEFKSNITKKVDENKDTLIFRNLNSAIDIFDLKLSLLIESLQAIPEKSLEVNKHLESINNMKVEFQNFSNETKNGDIISDLTKMSLDDLNKIRNNRVIGKLEQFVTNSADKAKEMLKSVGENKVLGAAWGVVSSGFEMIKTLLTTTVTKTLDNAIATGKFAQSIVDFAGAVKNLVTPNSARSMA